MAQDAKPTRPITARQAEKDRKRAYRAACDAKGICGSEITIKRTGHPCQAPAGMKTTHPGTGRCKWHGGNWIPKPKHAITGISEKIKVDIMPDGKDLLTTEERAIVNSMPIDAMTLIEKQILEEQIRIRRMTARLADHQAKLDAEGGDVDGLYQSKVEHANGMKDDKLTDLRIVTRSTRMDLIQRIENDITTVKNNLTKLITQKDKMEQQRAGSGRDDTVNKIDELVQQLKAADKRNAAG
jgi:hypothetical protein